MARAIWKGHISFGLVNIPIQLFSAEKRVDLSFHMVDSSNRKRVRYQRVNEETGEEVPWDRIVKGYEYDGGDYVLISNEELKEAAPEATQSIEIEQFVEEAEISHMYFDKPYYLEPGGKKAQKGYVLLREAMKAEGKAGIARVVIRSREHLAALVPMEDGLVLNLLRFDQELRNPDEFNFPEGDTDDYNISKKEMTMATQLINSMADEWNPEDFHDEYREKLLNWIEEKVKKGETKPAEEVETAREKDTASVVDMSSLLEKSVKEKQSSKKTKKTSRKRKAG